MKKLEIVLCLITCFISIREGMAQQAPVLSTYTYNLITVNPAYAGYYQTTDISVAAGSTIPHVEGAPQYGNLTINSLLPSEKVGLGGVLAVDKIGITSITDVYATYAYKLISRNRNSYTNWEFYPQVISFGLQAGFSNIKEDLLSMGIDDDPNFSENVNETVPSFGAGFFYSHNHIYIGLSTPHLFRSFFSSHKNLKLNNHYYFQCGYKNALNEKTLIKPALLVKYVHGAPVQFDANVVFEYKDLFELGAGYRSTTEINLLAGIHIGKKMRLVYHFDAMLHNNVRALRNSNGILLSIRPTGNFHQ